MVTSYADLVIIGAGPAGLMAAVRPFSFFFRLFFFLLPHLPSLCKMISS